MSFRANWRFTQKPDEIRIVFFHTRPHWRGVTICIRLGERSETAGQLLLLVMTSKHKDAENYDLEEMNRHWYELCDPECLDKLLGLVVEMVDTVDLNPLLI